MVLREESFRVVVLTAESSVTRNKIVRKGRQADQKGSTESVITVVCGDIWNATVGKRRLTKQAVI